MSTPGRCFRSLDRRRAGTAGGRSTAWARSGLRPRPVGGARAGTPPARCLAAVAAVLIGGFAPAQEQSRPQWVTRYLQAPPEPWDGWRNSLAPRGEAVALRLSTNGTTTYTIVVPAQANPGEQRAADELQLWLKELTGVSFPIVPDSTPARGTELSVGRTQRVTGLAEAAWKRAGLAAPDRLPREGYAIVVDGERVVLLGDSPSGVLPAAFAFLEEDLGVRWYEAAVRQGKWDELTQALNAKPWAAGVARAPRQDSLLVAVVPRSVAPAFPLRHLTWQQAYNPWALRNRVNGGYAHAYGQHGYVDGGLSVHTFHRLVPPRKLFEAHPEYFALVGGKRGWEQAQLCLSNPEVADTAAQTAAAVLRAVPEAQRATRHLLDVSAEDWTGDCECDNCRALAAAAGGYSGLQLAFVNRVAERLAKDYPWVTVTTLAYRQSKPPPTVAATAHPNVAVRFCTDFGASFTWPYHSFYDTQIPDLAEQRQWFTRWQTLSPRMHLWVYPHQYRHCLAPMPSLGAVADNLRFFAECGAESMFVQQSDGVDAGREAMRYWVVAKLMWDPRREVNDLVRDFVWGYYGPAAPAVFEFERLLWDQHARYTDFARKRNWIYAIHDEGMYRHGFVDKARAILERAAGAADTPDLRRRIEVLKAGVVYIETVQLYLQMRDGDTPPDAARYTAAGEELRDLCTRLDLRNVGFFDGTRTVAAATDWIAELRSALERRLDRRYLPPETWGPWAFRWDPEDNGTAARWFALDVDAKEGWTPVSVPAFLADTPAGNGMGHGWYRTTFALPNGHAGRPVELHFGGVDEQAWVYVNGALVGEHSLKSEFMVGQEITVADLWDRPFTIPVRPDLLRLGENLLVVRIHNSAFNAGIHQPVRVYVPPVPFRDACDGTVLTETFEALPAGGIPARWQRYVQERDGQVFGIVGVSRQFAGRATLQLRDQRSHVAVWSASDEVLPAGRQWTVQFDVRLAHPLIYKAAADGAVFGLKRGERGSPAFLPVLQLDNGETVGKPVTLLGLGEVLASDLAADQWHRLVIRRDGTTWEFYLDDELRKTITGRDTDLRGLAFGSFRDWHQVAQDVHYANIRIGRFVPP